MGWKAVHLRSRSLNIISLSDRLLSLLGFVHKWPTSRWSATKKGNRFLLNGNGIMSSFRGRQFYYFTLYVIQCQNLLIHIYYIYGFWRHFVDNILKKASAHFFFFFCTQVNFFSSYGWFYPLLNISLHLGKWLQVLLCITNNSNKHQKCFTQS